MAHWHLPQFHKYLFVVVVILLVIVTTSAYLDNLNKPCKFLDSINITDGSYDDTDESITFDGIYYPTSLYAEYDYEFVNESYRQKTDPHIRGCTCKLKPCIRICCPRGQFLYRSDCYTNDSIHDLDVPVTHDGEIVEENIFEIFHYVVGKPCYQISPLEPEKYPDTDTWALYRVSYYKGICIWRLDYQFMY